MTPEDIERMAREAGFPFNKYGMLQGPDAEGFDADDMLARFAELVQAAERERCVRLCTEYAFRHGSKEDDSSKAQAWMMLQCAVAIRDAA